MTQDVQPLDTAEDLYAMLVMWHQQQLSTAEHMMEIPEGTDVTIEGKEQSTLRLEGEALRGFRFGLVTAIQLFGTLPFAPVEDELILEPPQPEPEQG